MAKNPAASRFVTEVAVVVLAGQSLPDASRCDLSVVLHRRAEPPDEGRLTLPSVLLKESEPLLDAARRAIATVVPTAPRELVQVGVELAETGDSLLVSYLATAPEIPRETTDNSDVETASIASIHERTDSRGNLPLLLYPGHHGALKDALTLFSGLIERTPISLSLIPEVFTLGQIRSIYESAWDKRLDVRNFRRKLVEAPQPFLTAVGQTLSSRGTEGRPPELYRATRAWEDGIPVRRPRPRNSR